MPKNPVITLGSNNCNSAVTFACASKGKLLIYRKEEWKKVLIHELFHSLCLDFAGSNYETLRKNIKNILWIDFSLQWCGPCIIFGKIRHLAITVTFLDFGFLVLNLNIPSSFFIP